jgi:hypothetical protein
VEPLTLQNAAMAGMWGGARGMFILPPDAASKYWQFLAEMLEHADWEQRFSIEYLNKRLRTVLEDYALLGEAIARTSFQALTDHLTAFDEEQTVYLPLLGVTLDSAPRFELGGITLHRATDDFLKSITTPETTEYIKRQSETRVWAEVKIIAEQHRAASRAEEACQPLIDVLRFWMACMAPSGTHYAIGLQGDVVTSERPRVIIDANGRHAYDPNRSRLIPGFPVCDRTITVLQSGHLDSLADLLTTTEAPRSRFIKLLLQALHLFGNASAAALPSDRFMNLMMALEAFLTVGDAPINQSVAEGVVIFLAVPLAERVRLKKELQRLYRLRSKLAHGEHTGVPVSDLCLLEDLTRSFLTAMIQQRNEFNSKEELLATLEKRRLS